MITWNLFWFFLAISVLLALIFFRHAIVEFLDMILGDEKEEFVKIIRKRVIREDGENSLSYTNIGVLRSFPRENKTYYILDVLMNGKVWEVGVGENTFKKVSENQQIKMVYHKGKISGEFYPRKIVLEN